MTIVPERVQRASPPPAPPWPPLVWAALVVGGAIFLGALGAFALTWVGMLKDTWWWIGGAATAVAAALLVPGLRGLRALHRAAAVPESAHAAPRAPTIPMLGALLVYRYRAITEAQLEAALAAQRKRRRRRQLLGDILVEMGYATRRQVDEALEYQRSCVSTPSAR